MAIFDVVGQRIITFKVIVVINNILSVNIRAHSLFREALFNILSLSRVESLPNWLI